MASLTKRPILIGRKRTPLDYSEVHARAEIVMGRPLVKAGWGLEMLDPKTLHGMGFDVASHWLGPVWDGNRGGYRWLPTYKPEGGQ